MARVTKEDLDRLEEIAKTHDLPGCMVDDCPLCKEYYLLLKRYYEVIGHARV